MAEPLAGKTVAILASHEFEDIEVDYPLLRLSEAGADMILVPIRKGHHPRPALEGMGTKPVTGRFGNPFPPEVMTEGERFVTKQFDELDLDELDCVLIPGGFSPDHLRIMPEVVDFVREAHDRGKIVASICHGQQVLIEADIVEGKTMTCYKAVATDLANAGADFTDEGAVRDGNIVSGRVPDDLPEFCLTLIDALETHEVEASPA